MQFSIIALTSIFAAAVSAAPTGTSSELESVPTQVSSQDGGFEFPEDAISSVYTLDTDETFIVVDAEGLQQLLIVNTTIFESYLPSVQKREAKWYWPGRLPYEPILKREDGEELLAKREAKWYWPGRLPYEPILKREDGEELLTKREAKWYWPGRLPYEPIL
ncbi:mating factor alpha [[Candida] anglica]